MVTGSFASTYYGEPRATRDLDIVIEPSPDELGVLVDDVGSDGYYVDRDAAFDALRQRTQFSVVAADAFKIDFIIRKDRPFSRWSVPFDSDRQLRDVAAMVDMAGESLHRAYIDRWAETLGVDELWRRLIATAD